MSGPCHATLVASSRTSALRRFALSVLLLLLLVAGAAAVAWPRARTPRVYATYGVANLVALLQERDQTVRGRVIAVHGYYHYGCPSCAWDAPPSLTVGSSWGGPSIIVALPDGMVSTDEPGWVTRWRALPILGRLAPALPIGPPQGFITFVGAIGPLCAQATICDAPPFVLHVIHQ